VGEPLPRSGFAGAAGIAASPSGRTVFVAGATGSQTSAADFAIVAYDTATGAQLWASTYNGPGNGTDGADPIAVSPDGARVFVTGSSQGAGTSLDYATIAFDAATGARLWVSRYNDPRNGRDEPSSLAVSPDGRAVFVTGANNEFTARMDYTTIAYSAATGAELWQRRYDGPADSYDQPSALAVSPDGHTVVVTGSSYGRGTLDDFATVAYNATSGRQLWVRRYNGPRNGADLAASVALSPDGRTAYVTGSSAPTAATGLRARYITIAYDTATGRRRWLSSYAGPRRGGSSAASVAVGPSGQRVYVTGTSHGLTSKSDYATIAYSAASGRQLWVRRYNGPANGRDGAAGIAASPGGKRVYVTGSSTGVTSNFDYATVAYASVTGRQLWADRYNGADGENFAAAMTVGPDGTIYVTGSSGDAAATIAYKG
jgi:DNA-binding beta-propeller fold protein YncE